MSRTTPPSPIELSGPAAAAALQVAFQLEEKLNPAQPLPSGQPRRLSGEDVATRATSIGVTAYLILQAMHAAAEGRAPDRRQAKSVPQAGFDSDSR